MSGSNTWNGKGTNWLTKTNWSTGSVPVNGTIASQTVIIPAISSTIANSPTLAGAYANEIFVADSVRSNAYTEYQLDGMYITIGSGADLTLESTVLGRPGGTGALTPLHATLSSFGSISSVTPIYDTALTISGTGNATLSFEEDSHNFAALEASGAGNSLNIIISSDGSQKNFLDNYGLIEASNGAIVTDTVLTASGTQTTAFANDGWIVASGGTFATNSAITDDAIKPNSAGTPDGYIEIGDNGEAILTGAVAAKEEVTFLDTTSNTLEIGSGTLFSGTINDFGATDELLISGAAAGTIASSFNTATGVLTVSDTANGVTTTEQITFTGTHPTAFSANLTNPSGFSAALAASTALGASSTGDAIVISAATACFAAGTRILTAIGQVAVEDLIIGDEVLLANGGHAPINWIGHRSLSLRRHQQPETVLPVLIKAGALGGGLPLRNLTVSPDHALYLEGCLIPAKALINGATIRQITVPRVTYYHIELPQHDVLYAEGVAAESYLETGNRGNFDNGGVVVTLHPDFAQTIREQQSCAPFIEDGPLVEAARQKILDNAGIDTTDNPAIFIRYRNNEAVIHSRSAIPGHIFADPRDRRRLGVKISGLEIDGVKLAVDHPALRYGWHGVEPDGRWTNGKAIIPETLLQGSRRLRVILAAKLRYSLAKPARGAARLGV